MFTINIIHFYLYMILTIVSTAHVKGGWYEKSLCNEGGILGRVVLLLLA